MRRVDLFSPPQLVTGSVAGQPIGTFTADSKEKKLSRFLFQPSSSGAGEMVEITIDVDKTFQPGGADTRELGIRVFHTFIEPK